MYGFQRSGVAHAAGDAVGLVGLQDVVLEVPYGLRAHPHGGVGGDLEVLRPFHVVGFVARDAVVGAKSPGALLVEAGDVRVQLGPHAFQLGQGLVQLGRVALFDGVHRLLELLQDLRLLGLVRVELQAVVAYAYLVHPLLDDLQSRPLLRHEQDGLALVHGVGYDVGDGLGLSGSGRSVHDERLALSGRPHRFDLGPVGGHAEAELVRVGVDADLRVGVIDPSGHQRVHDGVLLEPLDVLVQVLPHRVLAEREHSQGGSVQDFPSFHPLDASADVLRNAVHVDPGVVQGERVYARYHDVVFLAKLLGEGDVEYRFLVVLDDGVSLLLLHQLRRDQYERRVAGDLISLVFEPSQHSDGNEEGVASALLHLLPVEAVDRFYGRKGLPVGERGPDPSPVDLVHAGFGVVANVGLGLERPLGVDLGPVPVLRLGHYEELAAVEEDVLEKRGVGYQQGHGLGSDLHVDQRIPSGGVQKVALPHVDAG